MPNVLPQEANAPSLMHNKRQPYQICCVMRKEQMLKKKQQDEIIDRIDTNENALIQNASKPSELRNPCKNTQVEVALLQTRQCFPKNIDLTKIPKCQEAIDFPITIEEHQMQRRSKKFPQEQFFLLSKSKSQRPLTNEKFSPLNRNERTKIITTFQMSGQD